MSEDNTIHVNFGRPMAVFPLDGVVLLPQQVLPLHVFEPRYKQMVTDSLDGSGQFAMATFAGQRWKKDYHGRPPVRSAVCIAQIVQHEKMEDGRYNILIRGICRARIVNELPAEEKRLYRLFALEPVGMEQVESAHAETLRGRLEEMLEEGPLSRFVAAAPILEFVRNEEIPTSALMELVSFTVVSSTELRYKLLREPDADTRAALIESELESLSSLVKRAERQLPTEWPKGCSWN